MEEKKKRKSSRKESEKIINNLGYLSKRQLKVLKLLKPVLIPQNQIGETSSEDFKINYEQFKARHLQRFLPNPDKYESKTITELINKFSYRELESDINQARSCCWQEYVDIIIEAASSKKEGVNTQALNSLIFKSVSYMKIIKAYCRHFKIELG